MDFSHEQNILFSLIKTSLCSHKIGEAFLDIPERLDWNSLVNLAARQGVLCVARDGLVQMEQCGGMPKNNQIPGLSRELLIRWELSVQKLSPSFSNRTSTISPFATFTLYSPLATYLPLIFCEEIEYSDVVALADVPKIGQIKKIVRKGRMFAQSIEKSYLYCQPKI